jgi:hypothetical protein
MNCRYTLHVTSINLNVFGIQEEADPLRMYFMQGLRMRST